MPAQAEKLGEQGRILELDIPVLLPWLQREAGNHFQKEVLERALHTQKKRNFSLHNVTLPVSLSWALSLLLVPSHLHPSSLLAATAPGAHMDNWIQLPQIREQALQGMDGTGLRQQGHFLLQQTLTANWFWGRGPAWWPQDSS